MRRLFLAGALLLACAPHASFAADGGFPFEPGLPDPSSLKWDDGPILGGGTAMEPGKPPGCGSLAARIDAEAEAVLSGFRQAWGAGRSTSPQLALLKLAAGQDIAMFARLCSPTDYDLRMLSAVGRMNAARDRLAAGEAAGRECQRDRSKCARASELLAPFALPRFSSTLGAAAIPPEAFAVPEPAPAGSSKPQDAGRIGLPPRDAANN